MDSSSRVNLHGLLSSIEGGLGTVGVDVWVVTASEISVWLVATAAEKGRSRKGRRWRVVATIVERAVARRRGELLLRLLSWQKAQLREHLEVVFGAKRMEHGWLVASSSFVAWQGHLQTSMRGSQVSQTVPCYHNLTLSANAHLSSLCDVQWSI